MGKVSTYVLTSTQVWLRSGKRQDDKATDAKTQELTLRYQA